MRAWLGTWGASAEGDADGMDHGGAGSGSGMTSEEDMVSLASMQGAEFDRMYVEMMIAHHQGAVTMADQEIADGESLRARSLAKAIKAAQEAEIAEMRSLLEEL